MTEPKDPRRSRLELGALVVTVALLIALGAYVLWGYQTHRAHERTIEYGYVNEEPADHAGAVALGAVAGILFLSGVIVMASAPEPS